MLFVCVYLHCLEFFAIPYVSNSQIVSFTIIYLKASWINVLMTTPWSVRYSTNAYHIIRFNALCDGWMSIQGISSFGKRNTNTCQNAPTFLLPKRHIFYCQNGTFNHFFLLKRRYMYHVWCLVIQDLSSKGMSMIRVDFGPISERIVMFIY
jgi:hypothetical protein